MNRKSLRWKGTVAAGCLGSEWGQRMQIERSVNGKPPILGLQFGSNKCTQVPYLEPHDIDTLPSFL